MIEIILYGLVTGFTLSLSLGTVFFSLIQNSVENGYKSGVFIALGVALADLIFLSFILFGSSYLPTINNLGLYINILGGIMLISLGFYNIRKKSNIEYPETKQGNILYFIGNGFLLNAVNPANFFIWATLITKLKADSYQAGEIYLYLIACMVSIFFTEIGVSLSASKLKNFFTNQKLTYINMIAGIAFVIFGLLLFWQAYKITNV